MSLPRLVRLLLARLQPECTQKRLTRRMAGIRWFHGREVDKGVYPVGHVGWSARSPDALDIALGQGVTDR
eukprot:5299561-Prymnesium_polylepis.1